MIGDIVIASRKDKLRAEKLLKPLLRLKDRPVIAIQGGSGTKKTELMQCLQETLHKNRKRALGISIDDYYKVHYSDRTRTRKRKGLKSVGLNEIDWVFLKKIVRDYKNNTTKLNIQYINKYTDSFLDVTINNSDKLDYLIIEGLYAGYLKKFNLVDFCIHLEGSPKQTEKFRRFRGKEYELGEFRRKIVAKEYNTVSQLKRYCDTLLQFED